MLFTLAENYTKPIHLLCLESLIRHNPDVKVFTKESIKELNGGEEFLNKYQHASNVHFSDIFRMWYIYTFGGAWIDADCIHLRTMEHPDTDKTAILYADYKRKEITQTYTFAKNPGNRFIELLLDRQTNLLKDKGPAGLSYLDLGEWSINHIRQHSNGNDMLHILPHWEHLYIAWYNSGYFHQTRHWGDVQFDRGLYNPNAYCYHLTNRILAEFGHFQRHDLINHDSFLGFLCHRAVCNGFNYSKDSAILKRLPSIHSPYKYCEIGVYKGHSIAIIGQQRTNSFIIGVDPWSNTFTTKDYKSTNDYIAYESNETQEHSYQEALANTWFLQSQQRINLIRKTSVEASKDIADKSLDMVFIDGDHSYKGCKEDIQHWLPKVKIGGWIGGHDYKHPNFNSKVHIAVDELFTQIELDDDYTWFVQIKS